MIMKDNKRARAGSRPPENTISNGAYVHGIALNDAGRAQTTIRRRVPVGAFIDVFDEQGRNLRTFAMSANIHQPLKFEGRSVDIRVRLPGSKGQHEPVDFTLDIGSRIEPAGLIGEDERKPYMCYKNDEVARHALATAVMVFGGAGTGSSIGKYNKFLTNAHVVIEEERLKSGEVWFYWVNEDCDPASPELEPVRLETDKLLATGRPPEDPSGADWAVFTVKEFDFVNAHVKQLFGALEVRETNPAVGTEIYIPQHGNGGLYPMHIGMQHQAKAAVVLSAGADLVTYNADTQGGSSGSPVIDANTHQIVALHAFGISSSANGGPSPAVLFKEAGEVLREGNGSIIGDGNVVSFNLETNYFSNADFTLRLAESGSITAFNTVTLQHRENDTLASLESMDILTGAVQPSRLRLAALVNGTECSLADPSLSGDVHIVVDVSVDSLSESYRKKRRWLALKSNSPDGAVTHYLVRITHTEYNPFEPPFEKYVKMSLNIGAAPVFVDELFEAVQYSFVALFEGQGPLSTVYNLHGYAELKAAVKDEQGGVQIVSLRGSKHNQCSERPMNDSTPCDVEEKLSYLRISFEPTDNPLLDLTKPFHGILPVQAVFGAEPINILIEISTTSQ